MINETLKDNILKNIRINNYFGFGNKLEGVVYTINFTTRQLQYKKLEFVKNEYSGVQCNITKPLTNKKLEALLGYTINESSEFSCGITKSKSIVKIDITTEGLHFGEDYLYKDINRTINDTTSELKTIGNKEGFTIFFDSISYKNSIDIIILFTNSDNIPIVKVISDESNINNEDIASILDYNSEAILSSLNLEVHIESKQITSVKEKSFDKIKVMVPEMKVNSLYKGISSVIRANDCTTELFILTDESKIKIIHDNSNRLTLVTENNSFDNVFRCIDNNITPNKFKSNFKTDGLLIRALNRLLYEMLFNARQYISTDLLGVNDIQDDNNYIDKSSIYYDSNLGIYNIRYNANKFASNDKADVAISMIELDNSYILFFNGNFVKVYDAYSKVANNCSQITIIELTKDTYNCNLISNSSYNSTKEFNILTTEIDSEIIKYDYFNKAGYTIQYEENTNNINKMAQNTTIRYHSPELSCKLRSQLKTSVLEFSLDSASFTVGCKELYLYTKHLTRKVISIDKWF